MMNLYARHLEGDAMAHLLHELIFDAAARTPGALALRHAGAELCYSGLASQIGAFGAGLVALGAAAHDRVALWMPNSPRAVVALFGASAGGCAVVPLDPCWGARRVEAALRDAGVRVLVTSAARLAGLERLDARCPALRAVVVADDGAARGGQLRLVGWDECVRAGEPGGPDSCVETDLAALLYRAGAGPRPKALALSHRNLLAAADGSARYLGISARDRLLAALPFSLDYGLNQLTSAFAAGASVVLADDLSLPGIVQAVECEAITGLAGVPPMWTGLARRDWHGAGASLRYITNSGGMLERATLDALRGTLPAARVHLMYGLAEAFRSTCLGPEQLERHPGAIGRPGPHADVMVLRPDGRRCPPGEPGELVQRGPLVALGYWNDPARTAERFRPLPPRPGLALAETAWWSGATARIDDDGYLYLVGGADSIETCGHRVSPAAVEEVVYGTGLVEEAAAVGVAHPVHGAVIAVLARPRAGCRLDSSILFGACRARLPGYMLPAMVDVRRAPLPRAANGGIDRALLAGELAPLFAEATA
jgi:acyl-CoA ligase (AMP-forming) (exosortase A-associated)